MTLTLHVFYALFLLASLGVAAPPGRLSPGDKKAFQTIAAAERFCDEAVGYSGQVPQVVLALRALLKSDQGDAAFKQLLADATIAGKLYALCGLYYTDPGYFEQAVQPFRRSDKEVQTFMGCIISRDRVGSIVEQSRSDVVRLTSRTQTIKQWATETKRKSMSYDIVGGGWPNSFKESGGYRKQ